MKMQNNLFKTLSYLLNFTEAYAPNNLGVSARSLPGDAGEKTLFMRG